ncbi:MAG: tryptophan--tRNA ligase [Actinobacteria bacterium]|nr:tryptophan--tRNA ligase [Actinomycetota bacterium]
MERVLSGIQPTGEVHLGNYIGALRHWASDQDSYDCFFAIVDLHAITLPQDPEELRSATLDLAAILLAAGIDPERSTVFVQSHVAEHAELAWILQCFTSYGELQRMIQFKDKASKRHGEIVSAGLFTYPVLQAADILIYRADRVPVGEDQRQHLELTRDIAGRFNQRYGETFVLPQAAIPRMGAKILDLQMPDAKMSKSADSPLGTLKVTDPPEEIRRKVKVAVTDSGREVVASPDKPAITNLLTIYAVATGSSVPDVEASLAGKGYAELKAGLAEALVEFLRPLQDRRRELLADPGELARILRAGAEKAREVARKTLSDVYERVGFLPRSK